MKWCILILFPFFCIGTGFSQFVFTHADTLRGMLRPERICFDVTFYDLDVKVDPENRSLSGRNTIHFKVIEETKRLQLDLFSNMTIERIVDHKGNNLKYTRDGDAVFVRLAHKLNPGANASLTVTYAGVPVAARNPPWDGGFVWKQSIEGEHCIGVACQGFGASSWWPCKDHQTDEPDSMRIAVTVPNGLINVSNGRLRTRSTPAPGWERFEWFVTNPINTYNVTLNIANYSHFSDTFINIDGHQLSLDYYVMPGNEAKASAQFQQVPPMLRCFEQHFGAYPFLEDGYKLVETAYLGMEHQSAIAYGNRYQNGYLGSAMSEEGRWFDYIIIHETAHEWFGNSLTSADVADMWIHESFGTYMEAVYVECLYGRKAGSNYLVAQKGKVKNDRPIVGIYNVQHEGSGDMYYKGALMLHTLRQIVNNDTLWWNALRDLAVEFEKQIVDYDKVSHFLSSRLRTELSDFFHVYLRTTEIPLLELRLLRDDRARTYAIHYRWKINYSKFFMPVKIWVNHEPLWLQASDEWKILQLDHSKSPDITLDPNWLATMQIRKR